MFDTCGLWQHEQLRARGRFMTVVTPTGTTEVYRPPFNISGLVDPEASVPALGAHDPALVEHLLTRSERRRGATATESRNQLTSD